VETKDIRFEVKALGDDGEFSGYASVFGNLDRQGDVVLPGAFAAAIPDFLKDGVVCWQHDWEEPIGKPIECKEDATGLFVRASILPTEQGKDALILMRGGVVTKLSFGFDVKSCTRLYGEACDPYFSTEMSDGEKAEYREYGIRLLTQVDPLYEISPVTVPANNSATITAVKRDAVSGGGAHAALTLADESDAALAACEGLITRLTNLKAIRSEDGRPLSQVARAHATGLAERLVKAQDQLGALLAERADPNVVAAEIGRFEVLRAHALGVNA
jgi:uncharacterized protein